MNQQAIAELLIISTDAAKDRLRKEEMDWKKIENGKLEHSGDENKTARETLQPLFPFYSSLFVFSRFVSLLLSTFVQSLHRRLTLSLSPPISSEDL